MRQGAMAGFESPAYIASLIASINDGARAAQTGGLFMLGIAVYLMATVISTTDEVLLRGTFVDFSQIGVKVPVVASYALAPLVFLFLYVHTLIRYDMLAENLRLFDRELRTSLACEADRNRCRQLLANVEFVQYWTAPAGSPWHSWVYAVVVWVMLVAVPLLVFLATQISFLRYQNFFVTYVVHLGSLAAALSGLVYFWYRQARRRQDWRPVGRALTLAANALPAVMLFTFAAVYLGIPPVNSETTGRHAKRHKVDWNFHPLDFVACPLFDWGCRYLRLDHRLLVDERPAGEVLYQLRSGDGDLKLLLRVEALYLRSRSFRFADFSESEFFDVTLASADLRNAALWGADLWGANLWGAKLEGADLDWALLQDADLSGADLTGANLTGVKLEGADLKFAQLRSVNLEQARLQGANLEQARLQGANLEQARLQGANLERAQLQDVNLWGANLEGANLEHAQLQRANLEQAQLQGANLQGAAIWQAQFDWNSDLSLADLRGIDLLPVSLLPLEDTMAFAPATPSAPRLPVRIDAGKPALVDAKRPRFAGYGAQLTTDARAYDAVLAHFLANLARSSAVVARGVARRVLNWSLKVPGVPERPLWPDLARRLLAAEKDGAFQLDLSPDERRRLEGLAARAHASPDTRKP